DGRLLYAVDFTGATAQPTRFFHFDRLGSTLATTGQTGAILAKYAYGPYGELLTGSSPVDVFLFIGELGVRTEGFLYQMGDRYYDPQNARFLSRDSAPPRLTDPRSLDPYLYALGNPTRYVDPDGADSYDGTFFKGPIASGRPK